MGAWAFTASAEAQADAPHARFLYERAESAARCPEADEVEERVAARLGYDPFEDDAASLVELHVSRQRGAMTGHIVMRDAAGEILGERTLTSRDASCQALMASVEVAIAIAIDPVRAAQPIAPEVVPEPVVVTEPVSEPVVAEPVPVIEPVVVTEPVPEPAPETPGEPVRLRVAVDLHTAILYGDVPSVGLDVGVGFEIGFFSLDLEGRAELPTESAAVGGRVHTSVYLGSLVPCFHYGVFSGCLDIGTGALRTEGDGFAMSRYVTSWIWQAGARAGVEVPVGDVFRLRAHAALATSINRVTLILEDGTNVWHTPDVWLRITLGAAAVF